MRYEAKNAAEYRAKGLPWNWPNFTPEEMACKGSGRVVIDTEFMDRLQKLRSLFRRPMRINSGYRTPEHNVRVSSTGPRGPHTFPAANAGGVDVGIYGTHAYELVGLAIGLGFTGIGLSQKGDHAKRFVHLDDIAPGVSEHPRPWVWSY